jgi:hypothetical protein
MIAECEKDHSLDYKQYHPECVMKYRFENLSTTQFSISNCCYGDWRRGFNGMKDYTHQVFNEIKWRGKR